MKGQPNVLLILNDDMGYSDIRCYGGEVDTPNLDRLAAGGLRFTQFYNTARCSPSRASLLTGLHPHQTGIGILTDDTGPEGYPGTLNRRCVTLAEVLDSAGYMTYMSGKWHLAHDMTVANEAWPNQRGFVHHYGTITGAGSYYDPNTLTRDNRNIEEETRKGDFYYTDAISDNAVAFIHKHFKDNPDRPFFQYVAYTSPHWPLHAKPQDIAKYRGRFDRGWDRLREERLHRMIGMKIIDPKWKLSDRDPAQPPWDKAENKEWETRRMEVYAAQIDCMDQGIGRIIRALEDNGELENTVIIFLADNGGCAEEITEGWIPWLTSDVARAKTHDGRPVRFANIPGVMPGAEDTYQSYGVPWANLSNTPFRFYKHWVHEGGIATPFIVHWPDGITASGELRHQPAQLTDVMPTVLRITGAQYPKIYHANSTKILPVEGRSLVPVFAGKSAGPRMLFWEHEGNAAIRDGKWKLVKNFAAERSATPGFDPEGLRGGWELYDMDKDRTELHDLAKEHPDRVERMAAEYGKWAERCCVVDRERILEIKRSRSG